MSATGRGSERHESDFYETPQALADAACRCLSSRGSSYAPEMVLDPGAGRGVWGRAVRRVWHRNVRVIGVDPNFNKPKQGYSSWLKQDYTALRRAHKIADRPDLIIGNPPFSLAREFIETSLKLLRDGGRIAFLLRLNFLAGIDRWEHFYSDPCNRPTKILTCVERPSFKQNGKTDATEYGIWIWDDRISTPWPYIDWLSWKDDHEQDPVDYTKGCRGRK